MPLVRTMPLPRRFIPFPSTVKSRNISPLSTPSPSGSRCLPIMSAIFRPLASAAYTVFLFNQHDIISTLGPAIVVGCVLSGIPDLGSLLSAIIWHELHLLPFQIKNQIYGVEEDRVSKPSRPLPQGRLTVQSAQRLYLGLTALAILSSASLGLLMPGILHIATSLAYNEGGLAKFWALKSFMGSIGYMCYCWGMTVIFDNHRPLSRTSLIAVVLSGLIFTTTGHAQDFRDRDGDRLMGRKTLAIVLPQRFGRWSLTALILAWTVGLTYLWDPPIVVSVSFIALAAYTTANFVRDHSQEADRVSYWWYNIWLVFAHVLPLFRRL
ncbi:UbiA prenyltransferase family-domain-containing protein [Mycena belliarum]|uniref:UbiA prenyltransferase family-domain-containing protein n=1 Tax=Mycena belliarum TaxID=1033014 RepID=A0AAD6XQD4_9AGAR|nr:UbiA prenyltransferase family-domain-containing protein [Mycena belliae]